MRITFPRLTGLTGMTGLTAIGVLLAAGLLMSRVSLQGQIASVAGDWYGVLVSPVGDIGLKVRLQQTDSGAWTGTLDIVGQNAGLELKEITIDQEIIRFAIAAPGDPAFRGVFLEGRTAAAGQLQQGSGKVPMKLARDAATLTRLDITDDTTSIETAIGPPGDRPFFASIRHPAIQYPGAPTADAITELNRNLSNGSARLKFEGRSGYLRSLLDALHVSIESQALIFSKTSVQASHISPTNPRALYFSDNVAVGFIRNAPFIEVAVQDPKLGALFFTLDQRDSAQPRLQRQDDCLGCHESRNSMDVPGMLVRSVAVTRDGLPSLTLGNYISDHRSPLEERWGGWYVTGSTSKKHLGNSFVRESPDPLVPSQLRTVQGKFDLDGYASPYSDVAALLVFDHQMHMMNLITRMGWETRVALYQQQKSAISGEMVERLLVSDAAELVDYMLFIDEADLAGKIETTSKFVETFAQQGPRDGKGRTLREFDLQRRLMRYPCSYMIYSEAFAGLPVEAKDAIYLRMSEVLSGRERDRRYARLSEADRKAIVEILRDTKKDLPSSFGR